MHRSVETPPRRAHGRVAAKTSAIAAALLIGAAVSTDAVANPIGSGTLTCQQIKGSHVNVVVHSSAEIRCVFRHKDGGEEHYQGKAGVAVGLDLHWKEAETLTFTVIGANVKPGVHALAGKYLGTKLSASAGEGGGAKLLVGGHAKSIKLKPAVVKSKGIGATIGLGYMQLEAVTK